MNYPPYIDLNQMMVSSKSPIDVLTLLEQSWSTLTVLLSVIGNVLVLVASIRHKTLRLDRISIVILENLAVADLAFSLFYTAPNTVYNLMYGYDPATFEETLLFKIIAIPGSISVGVSCLLFPILNTCKLVSLIFPLRVRNFRFRDGYKIVTFVWTLEFGYGMVLGLNALINPSMEWMIASAIGLALLLLYLLGTTLSLVFTVHKLRGLQTRGFFSIILVSAMFWMCYVPLWVTNLPTANLRGNKALRRASENIYVISSFSNPLVYYLTIRSFKEYVNRLLSWSSD